MVIAFFKNVCILPLFTLGEHSEEQESFFIVRMGHRAVHHVIAVLLFNPPLPLFPVPPLFLPLFAVPSLLSVSSKGKYYKILKNNNIKRKIENKGMHLRIINNLCIIVFTN